MTGERRFHPFGALHLLRKTILVYLVPLVQVLFARNWEALRAALVQDAVLFSILCAVSWVALHVSGWQLDEAGTLQTRWRFGVRLDRTLRAGQCAALTIERPLLYRMANASRVVLYPVGQKRTFTLYLTRQDAQELADRLMPMQADVRHHPRGGEKFAFAVLGANSLSTLALLVLAIRQSQPYAPDAQTIAFAQLSRLAAWAARWLPAGAAWLLVLAGVLLCISLGRSFAQAVHYEVWRSETQLGSRGGLLRKYEYRVCRAQLNAVDVRRSPATWALHFCPVFVTAGSCRPELPLFVWRDGSPLLQELLPGVALPPAQKADTARRSLIFFAPAGGPLALCLLLTAVSRYTLPALTVPLLVPTGLFAALLAAAAVGYQREGIWAGQEHLTLCRQHGFHLHCTCVFSPLVCLTEQQSPWAVAAGRSNLTLTFPGGEKCRVRSIPQADADACRKFMEKRSSSL